MENRMKKCTLCPRACGVDRSSGEIGFCGASDEIKIGRAALHFWEEPCISGENGSGTVFFSHCTMKCVYCQNYKISTANCGRTVSEAELAGIFLDLQAQGAANINLVTPTHFVPQIIHALDAARKNGLALPVVYNTGGYETVDTIKALEGYVDVFLPDLKYFDDKYAVKYSSAKGYFKTAAAAIEQMVKQTGPCRFDGRGMIKSGVIVRHMLLPGLLFDSKKIIDYLFRRWGDDIYISIMSQYTPLATLPGGFPELARPLPDGHYGALLDYAAKIGVENAYIQEGGAADESFIPEFYGE